MGRAHSTRRVPQNLYQGGLLRGMIRRRERKLSASTFRRMLSVILYISLELPSAGGFHFGHVVHISERVSYLRIGEGRHGQGTLYISSASYIFVWEFASDLQTDTTSVVSRGTTAPRFRFRDILVPSAAPGQRPPSGQPDRRQRDRFRRWGSAAA